MLYPFKQINDIPVFKTISGQKLIKNLKDNINHAEIITDHPVKNVIRKEERFIIDDEYEVRSVVITTGNGAFNPKKFPIKTSDEAQAKIRYFIKDPKKFKDQTIGVFGGGDSALDWALELANYAKVKLIHRRPQFRGLESTLAKLRSLRNVEILTPYLPKNATVSDNQLVVELKQIGREATQTERFDNIVVAYGFKANNNIVKSWGVELAGSRIKVNSSMQTNIPGIYAAGDVITYDGRVPVIGVGFGEAQIAITQIMRELFPEKTLTIHSTSM